MIGDVRQNEASVTKSTMLMPGDDLKTKVRDL